MWMPNELNDNDLLRQNIRINFMQELSTTFDLPILNAAASVKR